MFRIVLILSLFFSKLRNSRHFRNSCRNRENFLPRCNVIEFAGNNKPTGLFAVVLRDHRRTKVLRPCLLPFASHVSVRPRDFQRLVVHHPPTGVNRRHRRSLGELINFSIHSYDQRTIQIVPSFVATFVLSSDFILLHLNLHTFSFSYYSRMLLYILYMSGRNIPIKKSFFVRGITCVLPIFIFAN